MDECHYGEGYARRYIEGTLRSPYTTYKNEILAKLAKDTGASCVLDLGCNVNPIIKREGSLRFQMEQQGIYYIGMDLSPLYFDTRLASDLEVRPDEIYTNVVGVVGDMLRIPMKDSSFALITCVDVLEHVQNPDTALKEIARVLSANGRALIVLPSMYKLDMGHYPHIEIKRKSSHKSKLGLSDWEIKLKQVGLEIDYEKSRPLGIASGLSYLAWLSDDYVPERERLDGEERYSEQAALHQQAKRVLTKYDKYIDDAILSNQEIVLSISNAMRDGDIKKVFTILKTIVDTLEMSGDERQTCDDFFNSVSCLDVSDNRIKELQTIYRDRKNDLYLMGNSILVVLKKK